MSSWDSDYWLLFPNSDSLGLLTLKADGRHRVPGCRPGRCLGGVSVVSRWCLGSGLGGVSMVSRCPCCLGDVSVVSRCYLVVCWWCLGCLSVLSRLFLVGVSSWCVGGVSVVSWWCLGCLLVVRWCLLAVSR